MRLVTSYDAIDWDLRLKSRDNGKKGEVGKREIKGENYDRERERKKQYFRYIIIIAIIIIVAGATAAAAAAAAVQWQTAILLIT